VPPEIVSQIQKIYDYIAEVFRSPQSAKTRVDEIYAAFDELKTFPEAGFNADEKVKIQIVPDTKSYGTVICKGQYIVVYQIYEKNVYISHLLPTRSDYGKLFH
jgi:plasmid stabilization system protein ParE